MSKQAKIQSLLTQALPNVPAADIAYAAAKLTRMTVAEVETLRGA